MLDDNALPPQKPLRPPAEVMRLRRMGASFPTRLSFLRTLMRNLASDGVTVERPVWNIDTDGFGHAVYTLNFGGHDYALIAVSTDLPDDQRTDRVIATAWDTSYVLFDGLPNDADIARIVRTAPLQEAARFTEKELVLSRANKSVRLFDHVVSRLRAAQQPDEQLVQSVGYLMRTTAVYGNGKFGIADRAEFADRPGLSGPFAAEMLTVWLIRGFTHDLVEHVGQGTLAPEMKRQLGIGNSTGLGMAPFLVSHPLLLDAWMQVRETALARVRALKSLTATEIERVQSLAKRAALHLQEWNVPDQTASARINLLRREWSEVEALLTSENLSSHEPIDRLWQQASHFAVDTQELLAALLLEPFSDLVDGLEECLSTPFAPQIDPTMSMKALRALIQGQWDWALQYDFAERHECAQFWYVSEEKLEPRLGNRHGEPGAELESPLDIARQVAALAQDVTDEGTVGAFLRRHPQHRAAFRRVQTLQHHPYAEIHDNLISGDCLPIDMLRFKLAFFGASKFDPKSDRWTRITLCQGAPLFDELDHADDWWLPVFAS